MPKIASVAVYAVCVPLDRAASFSNRSVSPPPRPDAPLVELDAAQQCATVQLLDDLGFDIPQARLLAEQAREPAVTQPSNP